VTKVAIVGATGYAGEELIRLLAGHNGVELTLLQAVVDKEAPIGEILPALAGKCNLVCFKPDPDAIIKNADLVFLALPHTVSMQYAPKLIAAGKKVIDLSADYRLKDLAVYQEYYKTDHADGAGVESAVYGLPEVYKLKIKKANLIANPGCYPTSIILGAYPLAEKKLIDGYVIADSKTGYSGAGREKVKALLENIKDSILPYRVNEHQHAPEIEQELGCGLVFTPQVMPIERGMLSAIYIKLNKKLKADQVNKLYQDFYKDAPFVKLREDIPQPKDVVMTNNCEIGLIVDEEKQLVIAISVIDNLTKGASGQAIQNMNIMLGLDEKQGLA